MKYMQIISRLLQICRYVPAPGQYWADAASISPVPAWCWHMNNTFTGADHWNSDLHLL